jgi:hypothetical protein
MKTTTKPWDGSKSRWPDAESLAKACLINTNTGYAASWTKDKCELPIYEPSGELNENAVADAVTRLGSVDAPAPKKRAAAAKLRSLYATVLKRPAPPTLKNY